MNTFNKQTNIISGSDRCHTVGIKERGGEARAALGKEAKESLSEEGTAT